MAYEVMGVVARSKGAPVSIETVVVPDPGPGEAVVDVQACGGCATDPHSREGGINDEFPFLLGHEAAGVVSAVGEGVTNVAVGDFVILNWRAVCGQCRSCLRGDLQYCFNTHNAAQKMTLADGTELSPALGIGAFVEKPLVHSGQCTKVDPQAPATAAGLLGCGVMAGVGAAINTGAVQRGGSGAVFGGGGGRAWRCSAAAGSGTPPSPAPGWPGPARSSPSTSTTGSSSGPAAWAPRTPSTARSPTRSRPSGPSPGVSARTSPSTPWGTPRCSSRPSTAATSPA